MSYDRIGAPLREWWDTHQASGRERILIAVFLAFGACLWAWSNYDDAAAARANAAASELALQKERARQASLENEDFRERVRMEAEKARSWSFVEPTVFMAQMRAQSVLEDYAVAAGIPELDIIAERPAGSSAGPQLLKLGVEGAFDWNTFLTLLAYMEQGEASLVPTELDVSNTSNGLRFRMAVEAQHIPGGTTS